MLYFHFAELLFLIGEDLEVSADQIYECPDDSQEIRFHRVDTLFTIVSDSMGPVNDRENRSKISMLFLQAHKNAMEELGPDGVVRRLGHYAHLIDYLLFDSSHGTGKRLDTSALRPFVAAAHDGLDLFQTGIALAGGLHGAVVREDLPELIEQFPNLSWDAEGQLHPTNQGGKRPLNLAVT